MKIGNATLTVEDGMLSVRHENGGVAMDREYATELWPAIKRFAETGSLVPDKGDEQVAKAPTDDLDDAFILGFVHTPVLHRDVFVFGRCYRWNSQSAGWERGLDSHIAVSVPLIIDGEAHQYHAIAEFLRLRAKERETDAKIARLERAQMDAAAQAAANRLPEHDSLVAAATSPTSPTAWVLANSFEKILTRFYGLKPKAGAVGKFEIAFFDSEEEAEGVHDAMGLRGTVRPQLVNRRTLEPVA